MYRTIEHTKLVTGVLTPSFPTSPCVYIKAAQIIADALHDEWLVALLLDSEHEVKGGARVGTAHGGHIAVDPQEVFIDAKQRGAASVVAVRYHPHEGPSKRHRAVRRAMYWLDVGQDMGVPLRNYISCFLDGSYFSFREHASELWRLIDHTLGCPQNLI